MLYPTVQSASCYNAEDQRYVALQILGPLHSPLMKTICWGQKHTLYQQTVISILFYLQIDFIRIYYCSCMLYHLLHFMISYVFLLQTIDHQTLCPLVYLLLPWSINPSISVSHICFFICFSMPSSFLDIKRLLFSCQAHLVFQTMPMI